MTNFSSNEQSVLERVLHLETRPNVELDLEAQYDLKHCADWIKTNNFQRVCLQFPDYLLADAVNVSKYLKNDTQATIFLLADTSYASCCVDWVAASHIDEDAIIHFGTACLSSNSERPVLHVFDQGNLSIKSLIEAYKQNNFVDHKTLFVYETQFERKREELQESLSIIPNAYVATLSQEAPDDHSLVIFGRKVPKSVSFERGIFIGSDSMLLTNFALLMPDITWFIFEESKLTEYQTRSSKFLMKRLHLVEKLKDAAGIGILVGTLSVNGYLKVLERIKTLCKRAGKKCYTVAVGRPNEAKLANFPEIDVFVLVSCPENRLLIESSDFYQPIVSLNEVELAFGNREWSAEFSLDFRQLQEGGKLYKDFDIEEKVEGTEADVSLISGKIRSTGISDEEQANGIIATRTSAGALVESRGAAFLAQRSWSGLEQKLGETVVSKAVQGRAGIPMGYEKEGV